MAVKPKPIERIEIVCETCGLIAEIYRPKGTARPKLCDCPTPQIVSPSTRPRMCIYCDTRLNRYNPGPACGPCTRTREPSRRV
ncbi:MAG TPA: hypothetical protein PLV41_02330 [Miltoncostaeales bacterium]|jgi:hypothetical protein|nr:hypothetical protein [Miltoncostaeales bacterium]